MSEKRVTVVDIDDVLSPTVAAFIDFSNESWGTNLTVNDYTENWMSMWQVEYDEFLRRRNQWFGSGVLETLAPLPGSQEGLQKLSEVSEVILGTSRSSLLKGITTDWAGEHYGSSIQDIRHAGIFDTRETPASHLLTKAPLYTELNASLVIDDQTKHCIAAHELGIPAVVFGDYVWNRELKLKNGMFMAAGWATLPEPESLLGDIQLSSNNVR